MGCGLLHINRSRDQNSGKSATEIARELNVEAVVQGSVEQVGARLRVAVHLTDGPQDESLRSKDYEIDSRDAPALQGAVDASVAQMDKAETRNGAADTSLPVGVRANTWLTNWIRSQRDFATCTANSQAASFRPFVQDGLLPVSRVSRSFSETRFPLPQNPGH
jgi:hypothetical protein